MEEKDTFGKFLRRKREECGLTQKEMARRLYVTESAVSKWERGISYPDISLVSQICGVLNISEHELIDVYKRQDLCCCAGAENHTAAGGKRKNNTCFHLCGGIPFCLVRPFPFRGEYLCLF